MDKMLSFSFAPGMQAMPSRSHCALVREGSPTLADKGQVPGLPGQVMPESPKS